jgi:multicomponent Na+:H+ antiporter subunit D
LGRRDAWAGLGATAALTIAVVALGLLPDTLLALGRAAAFDLINPAGYIAATGLAGGTP